MIRKGQTVANPVTGETLIFAPDWEPVRWFASDNPLAYWGGSAPQSMYTYATPPVDMPQSSHSPAVAGRLSLSVKTR